jgi:hypothetical protein
MVERFREQISTEKLSDRLDRILRDAARALGDEEVPQTADIEAPVELPKAPRRDGGRRRGRR